MHQVQLISGTTLLTLRQARLARCSECIRGTLFISSHLKIQHNYTEEVFFN